MDYEKIKEAIKQRYRKRVDRDYWEHKYLTALNEIHLIEGRIGLRKKDKSITVWFEPANDLCMDCWKKGQIQKDCPKCKGTGKTTISLEEE